MGTQNDTGMTVLGSRNGNLPTVLPYEIKEIPNSMKIQRHDNTLIDSERPRVVEIFMPGPSHLSFISFKVVFEILLSQSYMQ